MAVEYLILLNDALKRHILTLDPAEKRRLREKFEFLAHGLWEAGVRVKRLKGTAGRAVLEARLSRAERLLFTLGRHEGRIAIYVWGLEAHDDVGRRARAILPENAPFLQFEPQEVREYAELAVDEAAPELFTQESVEEKAGEDYGPQKWLVLTDEEWRRLLLESNPDSLELHLFLTEEQRRVLEGNLPLLLSGTAGSGKTTILVYTLLRPQPPGGRRLFLTFSPLLRDFSERIYRGLVRHTALEAGPEAGSGTAGSGAPASVEFAVFRGLVESILAAHGVRFDPGREVGLEEFEGIFRNHRHYRRYDAELVWEEIRSIVKGAKPPLSARELGRLVAGYLQGGAGLAEVGRLQEYLLELKPFEWLAGIERLLERRTAFGTYDRFVQSLERPDGAERGQALFLLKELMELLEKKAGSFAEPLLSLQEYVRLGRKRAPNFLYDRREIYEVAVYYQERLEAGGLWDEIDLCRRALQALETSRGPAAERFRYDLVACDEVQDFADIQLALVFRLARDPRGLALAGDVKQIINPSGFRWEEVRQKYFERGLAVPEVRSLSLNFRCVGGIVRLANALLALKQRLVGLVAGELREDWKFQGKPPFLVEGLAEGEMLRRSRLTGAGRIVLARSAAERARLKKLLGSELVFTVREAKGLEFDTVLLWKFSADRRSAETWRRILREDRPPPEHAPRVRHEISLLYVALTRARNTLLIYDGPAGADVWNVDPLGEHLQRTSDPELLTSLWERVSAPREWLQQGHYFFERGYYAAAAESYRNAGDADRMRVAAAFDARGKGRHEEAAGLFARQGLDREAAESWEACRRYGEASQHWKRAGERERSRICRIRAWEQEGSYGRAAREWEKLGRLEEAARNWERGGDHARFGDWLYGRGEYGRAAEQFERARDWLRAAESRRRAGEPERAAQLYLKARRPELAARLYRRAGNTEKLLACYEAMGDHYPAALLYEKKKEAGKAIEHFRLFAGQSPENRERLLEEARRYEGRRGALKAAVRFSALGAPEWSAPVFRERGLHALARADFLAAGQPLEAAECLSGMGRHLEAAEEMEKLEFPGLRERVLRELDLHMRGGSRAYDPEKVNTVALEGQAMLERGQAERALLRFQAVHYEEGELEAWLMLGRDEQAVRRFAGPEWEELREQYLQRRGEALAVTPGLVECLVEERERRGSWFLYGKDRPERTALLAGRLLEQDREAALPLLRRYFDTLEEVLLFQGDIAPEMLELMLQARHAGALCRVAAACWRQAEEMPERIRAFFQRVRRTGEAEGDRVLAACGALAEDPRAFEEMLEEIPLGPESLELYATSSRRYREAADFLLARAEQARAELARTEPSRTGRAATAKAAAARAEGDAPGKRAAAEDVERAARICRLHGDRARAAAAFERAGWWKQAGREYRAAGLFEQARRCYRQAGDLPGVARTHEDLGEHDAAVEIWGRLGREKDAQRVRRKQVRAGQARLDLSRRRPPASGSAPGGT